MSKQRLQKVLAAAGFGSRRACEQYILDGRVSVNGRTPESLPVLVDPQRDDIRVDGRTVRREKLVYWLVHKPHGVICTNDDPGGRTRAVDLLPHVSERVYPVGRLDADSTGLLLMTNDGELAERLAHPRFGVTKTYRAEVAGEMRRDDIEKLKGGIWLAEGKTAPADVRVVHHDREKTVLEITLREGKNREIRRILARLDYKVRRLKRIRIGPLNLGALPEGASRPLSSAELASLRRFTERRATAPQSKRASFTPPLGKSTTPPLAKSSIRPLGKGGLGGSTEKSSARQRTKGGSRGSKRRTDRSKSKGPQRRVIL